MEDFRVEGIPDPSQDGIVKVLANAIDVLSTKAKYPATVSDVYGYLAENCPEAKGERSAAFFSGTVAKALDQMKQTEMLEIDRNGLRLTENGRWSLLEKEKRATLSKKDVDDSRTVARKPDVATVPKAATGTAARIFLPLWKLLARLIPW
jgi:hypothetical protein